MVLLFCLWAQGLYALSLCPRHHRGCVFYTSPTLAWRLLTQLKGPSWKGRCGLLGLWEGDMHSRRPGSGTKNYTQNLLYTRYCANFTAFYPHQSLQSTAHNVHIRSWWNESSWRWGHSPSCIWTLSCLAPTSCSFYSTSCLPPPMLLRKLQRPVLRPSFSWVTAWEHDFDAVEQVVLNSDVWEQQELWSWRQEMAGGCSRAAQRCWAPNRTSMGPTSNRKSSLLIGSVTLSKSLNHLSSVS